MSYCTNCGNQSSKKICPHCGVKRNSTHNFCEWCGTPINMGATICTNCKEKIKPSKGIFQIILGILLLLGALIADAVFISILCLIFAVISFCLTLPSVKHSLAGKKWIKIATTAVAIVLVFSSFSLSSSSSSSSSSNTTTIPESYEVIDSEAVSEAEVIFHRKHKLKNEASYVLNDSNVHVYPNHDGDENLALVRVVLDVSAENGFGGMNRKDYTIEMIFDYEYGTYEDKEFYDLRNKEFTTFEH